VRVIPLLSVSVQTDGQSAVVMVIGVLACDAYRADVSSYQCDRHGSNRCARYTRVYMIPITCMTYTIVLLLLRAFYPPAEVRHSAVHPSPPLLFPFLSLRKRAP